MLPLTRDARAIVSAHLSARIARSSALRSSLKFAQSGARPAPVPVPSLAGDSGPTSVTSGNETHSVRRSGGGERALYGERSGPGACIPQNPVSPTCPEADGSGDMAGLQSIADWTVWTEWTDWGARRGESGLSSARETVRRQRRRSTGA